jgi:hypothetical protein
MVNLLTAIADFRAEKARLQRDHDTREAMLDAYWLQHWDEELAWRDLVKIVADYTTEKPSGQ